MATLAETHFADLHLPADEGAEWQPMLVTRDRRVQRLNWDEISDLGAVRRLIVDRIGSNPHSLDDGLVHEGVPYRVTIRSTVSGRSIDLSRGLWPLPSLASLGVPHELIATLHALRNRHGLLVFLGSMGLGKTTLMSRLLIDFAERHSRLVVELNDAFDLPLHGDYGAGRIEQQRVTHGNYEAVMMEIMRSRGHVIAVNELRPGNDSSAATLIASQSGHLCLATTHGGDLAQGLRRLSDMAAPQLGGQARAILAEGLLGAVQLGWQEGPSGSSIKIDALFTQPSSSCPIRQIIRSDRLEQLGRIANTQRANDWAIDLIEGRD